MPFDFENWIMLQLGDSALPVGGFVASNGLEAFTQAGFVKDVDTLSTFLTDSLRNAANQSYWFIDEVYTCTQSTESDESKTARLIQIDKSFNAVILSNHVAHRASLAQVCYSLTKGVAYLSLVIRSFHDTSGLISDFKQKVLTGQANGHLPICFAMTCNAMGVSLSKVHSLFMFLHTKSIISAAVRLNIIGPYQVTRPNSGAIDDSRCIPLNRAHSF
jgi:urease accessory protein